MHLRLFPAKLFVVQSPDKSLFSSSHSAEGAVRMDLDERESLDKLAEVVIGAAYDVANQLGSGFLEKVYERALLRELRLRSIQADAQAAIRVFYKGESVGEYFADLLVDGRLIVELKCADQFTNEHLAQCLNYLKATGKCLALLIIFQKSKVEWRHVVHQF
jgi:GxxExxY protein